MKIALATCISTPLLVAPFAAADLPSQPVEGTVLAKSVQYSAELEGGDLQVWMDGQEVPAMYLPELEMGFEWSENIRLVDTYASVQEGAVQGLIRRFDEVALQHDFSMAMTQMDSTQSQESESSATSPLVGQSVRFQQGDGGWEVEMLDGDGAASVDLEGLSAAFDLADWALPEEAGAMRWSLPGSALQELIDPSGSLPLEWTGREAGERLAPEFGGNLEFVLKSGVDASQREVRIGGTVEWTESEKTDLSEVPVADGRATQFTDQVLELEGTLLWDSEAGHLVSLELKASVDGKTRIVRDPDQDGPSYESHTSLAGEMLWSVEFEAVEG